MCIICSPRHLHCARLFDDASQTEKQLFFYLKEGCVATALSWVFLSVFGCLPFVFSREIPSFTNALFETISGFTTTGASILEDVEALSHCALLWRSFTHWIGGMGVLVFLLAIVPMSGGSNINLMRAESPGPSVGKLVPKMVSSARILYGIYFGLTLLEAVLLVLGGMPLFDSVATSFGTAGTGGFGIKADSFARLCRPPAMDCHHLHDFIRRQFQCVLFYFVPSVPQGIWHGRSARLFHRHSRFCCVYHVQHPQHVHRRL